MSGAGLGAGMAMCKISTKPNKACSGHRAGAGQPEKPLANGDAQMSVGAIPTARRR